MLVRLGFVVVASVAVLTLQRANSRARHSRDYGQARKRKDKAHNSEHGEKEEEKEEVKTISGIINSARPLDDHDDDMLSEIESLLSGDIDIPIPRDSFDNGQTKKRKDKAHNSEHGEKEKKDVKTISDIINSTRPLDDHDDDMLSEIESLLSGDIDMELSSCDRSNAGEKEEEKEEVKTISGIINLARLLDDDDDDVLFEIESLLSGDIEIPIPSDRFNVNGWSRYNTYMANKASEIEGLRSLVKEMEEREAKLEGELLEYYGMKEMEIDVAELQKLLKIKTVEIDMLNNTINSLQEERKKLQDDVERGAVTKKELEVARTKIKELQRQIQVEAGQTKDQLMLLKQQVIGLKAKEEEAVKKEAEVERKLKKLKQLEVEVLELRRKNKELLYEKRDLIVKLDAAEGKITESDVVANAREEINKLRHTNEDLTKQVEGLQMNRFSEVEELVYLHWVNACLRFKLRDYQTPSWKVSACDLNRTLSLKSQDRAKQLMLEYAGSERGHGDTDLESVSSVPSSPGSEDFDNISIDSSSSRYSFIRKRPNLMQKIKKWGRSKNDSSSLGSLISGSPRRKPKGPLEAVMLKNAGDGTAITTYGKRVPNGVLDDENVVSSFQLMSKTVKGFADEKYPAYKDRHKLATERENAIKEKAGQARAQRFGGGHS
uniref:Protein CHUP1, chloroplastic n=1 Tax=Zea mays TaxID=4577 RepID=A0A804QQF9_MAIZE